MRAPNAGALGRRLLAIGLPLLVVVGGIAVAGQLAKTDEESALKPPPALPLVRTIELQPQTVQMNVESQGTVRPAIEADIHFEVGGRVIDVGKRLRVGSFIEVGNLMAAIDPEDYDSAVTEAEAQWRDAEVLLAIEQAEAAAAIEEWQQMQHTGEPPPLVRREPQVKQAEARVKAAKTRLEVLRNDVKRCRVEAPFSGQVVARSVEKFETVRPNDVIARLQSTSRVEVRLAIEDRDLRFLNLPIGSPLGESGPDVKLSAEFGGELRKWTGRIVRTEAALDPASRLVHLIAEVEKPYADPSAPMIPGLFVHATITGRKQPNVFIVPRANLREDRIAVLVEDGRLRLQELEVLRRDRELAYVTGGLKPGDQLCTTRLEIVSNSMQVRVAEPKSGAVADPDSATSEENDR